MSNKKGIRLSVLWNPHKVVTHICVDFSVLFVYLVLHFLNCNVRMVFLSNRKFEGKVFCIFVFAHINLISFEFCRSILDWDKRFSVWSGNWITELNVLIGCLVQTVHQKVSVKIRDSTPQNKCWTLPWLNPINSHGRTPTKLNQFLIFRNVCIIKLATNGKENINFPLWLQKKTKEKQSFS